MSDQPTKKFRIRCPSCGALMHSPVDPGGKTVKCPKCSQPFSAVAEVDPAPSVPPVAPMPEPPRPKVKPAPEPENPFAGIAEKIGKAPASPPPPPPVATPAAEEPANPFAGIAEKNAKASSAAPAANPFQSPAVGELPPSRAAVDGGTWTLEKIHPLQAGKVAAAFYAAFFVVMLLFYAPIFALAAATAPDQQMAAAGVGFLLIAFLFGAIGSIFGGFIAGALTALLYNHFIVRLVGGLRFDYR